MPPRADKRPRSSSRTPAILPVAEHPLVAFLNQEQRDRFVTLMGKPLHSTRFLSRGFMRSIGFHAEMRQLLKDVGLPLFYNLGELTYPTLTLEFLSAFMIDDTRDTVEFRLLNRSYSMRYSEFGRIFDINTDEYMVKKAPDEFCIATLWLSLTGLTSLNTSAMGINSVEHPLLRMFLRLLVGVFQGRHDVSKLNKTDLAILGSYLNVQRLERFRLHLASILVHWFDKVARGQLATIEIGGLVTHLAKRHCGFTEPRVGFAALTTKAPVLEGPYIQSKHHWTRDGPGSKCHWQVAQNVWVTLPNPDLPPVSTLPIAWPGTLPPPSYLIPRHLTHAAPSEAPVSRRRVAASVTSRRSVPTPSSSVPPQPAYDPTSFDNMRRTHREVNSSLVEYSLHSHLIGLGLTPSDGPHPSYYRGPEHYPGAIFEEYGVSPDTWGPEYGRTYGGLGGQWFSQTTVQFAEAGPSNTGEEGNEEAVDEEGNEEAVDDEGGEEADAAEDDDEVGADADSAAEESDDDME